MYADCDQPGDPFDVWDILAIAALIAGLTLLASGCINRNIYVSVHTRDDVRVCGNRADVSAWLETAGVANSNECDEPLTATGVSNKYQPRGHRLAEEVAP